MEDSSQAKQGLMSMFSDNAKTNFQRTFKPYEPPSKVKTTESKPETNEDEDANKEEGDQQSDSEGKKEEGVPELTTEQKNEKTVFVGNLPLSMNDRKAITKLFQKYGKIESVRFRSVPIAGAKVDRAGDQKLVKKVCANTNQYGDQKQSFNAYVVFEDAASIEAALAENNKLIENRHIRVDRVNPTLFDTALSIFVGNLPYRVDEEEVREFFAKVLPNGQDDIQGIRLVRDPETLLGKGIGYLLFKEHDHVIAALQLHDKEFQKNWKIRVTSCSKKLKKNATKKNAQNTVRLPGGVEKKVVTTEMINAKHAMKRISKTVVTKKKLLTMRKKSNNHSSKKFAGKKIVKKTSKKTGKK